MPVASSTTFFSPKNFPLDFIGGYHRKECPSPDYDFESPPPPTLLDIPFIWFENVLVYKFQVTTPPLPSEKNIQTS